MRLYLLLIFISQSLLFAQEPTEDSKPKGLFSVVIWNSKERLDIAYAPWGNFGEGNATIVPLSLFPDTLSAKCAYYTNGKLSLLKQKVSGQSGTGLPAYEKFVEVNLPMNAGGISDRLLLLIPPTSGKPTWSVYPQTGYDLALQTGTFKFTSYLSQPVELSFGESRFILPPGSGGSKTVEGKMKEGGRTIELSIKSGSQVLFSQQWPHVSALRGLFFIRPSQNGVQLMRFVDLPRPVEQALGFGLGPISKPVADEFQFDDF